MPESLGKRLKKIRESKGQSIEDVSETTRIPKKTICSIEDDRLYDIASSAFYEKSFVTSYAKFLGAQEEQVVKDYLLGKEKKEKPVLVLKGEKLPGDWFFNIKKHKRFLGTALLAVFGIWVFFFSFIKVTNFVKNVSIKFNARSAKKEDVKVLDEPKLPSSALHKAGSETTDSVKKEEVKLELSAHYNTWIRVISDGELLFQGILKKGTKDTWQAKKEIKLELGNAGGVKLKLNERKLGSPGKRGEKKTIVITKDGMM